MKMRQLLFNSIGLIIIFISISPIYLTLTSSLKAKTDLSSKWIISKGLYLENFKHVLQDKTFIQALINTTVLVVGVMVIVVLLGALTGYVLARKKTIISRLVLVFTLAVMMVPSIALLVPLYGLMIDLKLINTMYGAIILIATYGLPLSVFIFTNFIKAIPISLDEAAKIDGCSPLTTFFKIIFPLLGPVTSTVLIIQGVKVYNNYMMVLYFLQKPHQKTVTTYVVKFFSEYPQLNQVSAAALLCSLPIIIIYLFLQRYFIKGALDGFGK